MDLGDLPPWAFRYVVEVLRILLPWLRQISKRAEGSYGTNFRVPIADSVDVSDAITHNRPGKLSAAEDLFWWYVRIRVS
jgi:hypothetical protein